MRCRLSHFALLRTSSAISCSSPPPSPSIPFSYSISFSTSSVPAAPHSPCSPELFESSSFEFCQIFRSGALSRVSLIDPLWCASPSASAMTTNTVRVTNVSLKATEHDIQDFFSFSGEIENIELQRDGVSQIALVTFKEASALDTALLLSGATIVDQAVSISPQEDELTPSATSVPREQSFSNDGVYGGSSSVKPNQATDVISTIMARSVILSKDAAAMAKGFDDKLHLTASATASVSNLDKKTGFSEKFSAGSAAVNQQIKAVDEKYHVSEKTRNALAVAEEKVNTAGTVIMKNRYVMTGASWVTGAFAKVQKAAADVNQRAKEKAATMESEEHRSGHDKVFSGEEYRSPYADSYSAPPYPASERAAVSLSSAADSASVRYPNLGYDHYSPLQSSEPPATKPPPAEGLIL